MARRTYLILLPSCNLTEIAPDTSIRKLNLLHIFYIGGRKYAAAVLRVYDTLHIVFSRKNSARTYRIDLKNSVELVPENEI